MTVGEKIKEFRKEKGLTQKELSKMADIPLPTLQKYETGKFNPKVEAVKKIAAALDIPLLRFANVAGVAISELPENDRKLYVSLAEEAFKDKGKNISNAEARIKRMKEKAIVCGISVLEDEDIHVNFGICADWDDYTLDELERIFEYIRFIKFEKNHSDK